MLRLRVRHLLMVPFLLAGGGVPAWAQEPPPRSLFQQLFPNPSGLNGYEELVKAGELIRENRALEEAVEAGSTLTAKRNALADPAVRQARALVRQGLNKPIRSPHDPSRDTAYPALGLMRPLGRMLAIEQYVLLASGRVREAIESLRDALRLGYALQSDMIIGGLVGIAVDRVALDTFSRHLDQLSEPDCQRLMALAREWLATPDPAIAALSAERQYMIARMDAEFGPANSPLKGPILALLNSRIDAMLASLRQPIWQRKELPPISGDPDTLKFLRSLELDEIYSQALRRFGEEQARVQMLGVHAAIHRYRWEFNRLPASLEELRLGPLAVDPFTGKSLVYKRTGETTYEISSAGLTSANR